MKLKYLILSESRITGESAMTCHDMTSEFYSGQIRKLLTTAFVDSSSHRRLIVGYISPSRQLYNSLLDITRATDKPWI